MKSLCKIYGVFALCFATLLPVTAQQVQYSTEMARPRSTVDHTRTDRLNGKPKFDLTTVLSCPSGQTLSGGQCVLLPNQSAYGKAWTSYFIGQSRMNDGIGTWNATVNSDGSISTVHGSMPTPSFGSPTYLSNVTQCSQSGWNVSAWPIFTNLQRLNGEAPSDWSWTATFAETGQCSLP